MSDRTNQAGMSQTSRRHFVKTSVAAAVGAGLTGELGFIQSSCGAANAGGLKVGAAAAELQADDSMVIAGGIHPRYVKGQEGKLRASAVVLEKRSSAKLAIVACDVIILTRDQLDPIAAEIERTCGIPASNVLIN